MHLKNRLLQSEFSGYYSIIETELKSEIKIATIAWPRDSLPSAMGTDTNIRLNYPSAPSYLTSWVAQQQQQEVSPSFLWQQQHHQWQKPLPPGQHVVGKNLGHQMNMGPVHGHGSNSSRKILSGRNRCCWFQVWEVEQRD